MFTIGTAAGYVKNMALNIKWQERRNDPLKPRENEVKQEDPVIADIKRQMEGNARAQKIESIRGKLLSGQKLDPEELEYLRENSPDDYENAVKAEKEREEYKRELEACRSKDDVAKLNMRRLHKFGSEAKTISNNPNIPAGKKKTLLEGVMMRMTGIMDEHKEFIKTPDYQRLPDKSDEESAPYIALEDAAETELPETPEEQETADETEKLINDLMSAVRTPVPDTQSAGAETSGTYDAKGAHTAGTKAPAVSIEA